jgi:hypothetical protein
MAVKKRTKYTSKGGHPSVSRKTSNAIRRERPEAERLLNQMKNWAKGRRTMVTVENPNKNESNKRFIRVEGNDPKAFGPWRKEVRVDKSENSL